MRELMHETHLFRFQRNLPADKLHVVNLNQSSNCRGFNMRNLLDLQYVTLSPSGRLASIDSELPRIEAPMPR